MEYEDLDEPQFKRRERIKMKLARQLFYLVVDLVAPNAKAFVAFVVASAAVWLARHGVSLDADTVDALASGFSGLVTAVLVWLTANRT